VTPIRREPFDIRASVVVNAAGVWSDEVRTLDEGPRPPLHPAGQGHPHHRARRGFPCDIAAVIPSRGPAVDLRRVVGIPTRSTWAPPTPTTGPSTIPPALPEDVDYILGAANAVTTRQLTRADITGVWAGLRPLLAPEQKGGPVERTADLSRRHTVHTSGAAWSR
jgi:glycerol-3-phosphate dehydrogenase